MIKLECRLSKSETMRESNVIESGKCFESFSSAIPDCFELRAPDFEFKVWGSESGKMKQQWKLRLASENDIPALEKLISLSVHGLQAADYSTAQTEAALGSV